jgi:hypothetical protein
MLSTDAVVNYCHRQRDRLKASIALQTVSSNIPDELDPKTCYYNHNLKAAPGSTGTACNVTAQITLPRWKHSHTPANMVVANVKQYSIIINQYQTMAGMATEARMQF